MSHPDRMLSSREIANFRAFVIANPHLINRRSPQGAFDAMPPDLDLTRGMPADAFRSGGSFDMEDVEASAQPQRKSFWDSLRLLAGKLSREDFADIHDVLTGNARAEDDLPDLSAFPSNGVERAMATDSATLSEAAKIAPGFERIKIDGAPMGTRYRGARYDVRGLAEAAAIVPDVARIKIGA